MAAATFDALLADLAKDGATGSLKAGRSGTVYLSKGRVSYVESASTLGVEELLTGSGRVSQNAVKHTRQTCAATADGGESLMRQGVLSRGELQLCVLGATLDAAYFLLGGTVGRGRFKEGERHWLGVHWKFDVPGLLRECRRRRARLDHIWPSADLDTVPVVPVRQIRGRHVVLTALQWEILLGADADTAPIDLARRIGRPAYPTLCAVRELAAAGLLTRPEASAAQPAPAGMLTRPEPPGARPAAADRRRPSAGDTAPMDLPKRGGERTGPKPGPGGGRSSYDVTGDPADVELLTRLRDALEALQ